MEMLNIKVRAFIVGKEDIVFEKEVKTNSTYLMFQDLIIDSMDWLKSGENYTAMNIFRVKGDDTPTRRAVTIARDRDIMTAATMIVDFEVTFVDPEELLDRSLGSWIKNF